MIQDVNGNPVNVGDNVYIAMGHGNNQGSFYLAQIQQIDGTRARVLWDGEPKLSPWIKLDRKRRLLKL